MRVERYKKGRKIPGPTEACAPVLFEAGTGTGAYSRLGGAGPVAGREDIVKARLSRLMATLGEPTAKCPPRPADWRPALRRFLDGRCPAGTLVMHGRRLPNRPLVLEHLVIAPRGLVVVGPSFGQVLRGGYARPVPAWRAREAASHLNMPLAVGTAVAGDRRPALVRDTLRRRFALRSWLETGPWDGVPVLAAVCECPVARAVAHPWLVLDGLWLGTADQLPEWLVADAVLDLATRATLGRFLDEALPVA
ncbi:MAG: hypothetical protein ACLQVK_08365 [Acidimicrobiales bacterium]